MHPLNEPPGSEVTPRSLISRAVGLWFKTQEERGRYVFLLVTPSQTGRAKEAGREGGTEQEGRRVFMEVKVTVCQGGAGRAVSAATKLRLGMGTRASAVTGCGCCGHIWRFLLVGGRQTRQQRNNHQVS